MIAAIALVTVSVVVFSPLLPSAASKSLARGASRQALWPRPKRAAYRATASLEAMRSVGRIAFASDRDGNFEVYLMDADGGGQTRLTEDAGEDYSPAWSPDGGRLAFVSTRDGNAEIYVMNADGSGQIRLTNNSASDHAPAWTPDGSRIAFVTNRDGNDEIYLMNPDGSNPSNLTNEPNDDASFAFSPDGLMITFSSAREDGQFEIYTMSASGANLKRLTNTVGDDLDPSWSSQRIAFQSNRDESDEIYSMNSDGSNQLRLTNNADLDADPSQPTDGARILFSTSRDGNLEIYSMAADGTAPIRLTNNSAADIQPVLEPQGVIPPPPPAGAATVQFSTIDFNAGEGDGTATLTVVRSGAAGQVSTVDFATINGTATNRADYAFSFGTLTFNPGEVSKTLAVLLTDDVLIEDNETFGVTLSNPVNCFLGSLNTAAVTILDNDTSHLIPNPIDNARFYVNQNYVDFLNRAPDQAGLDFWINQITQCGNNITCLELRRINVAAAFFLSIEFQETGYFVYRTYKAAFGNLTGAPVPLRLREFLPDTQRIGRGVVVGQAGWEQVLETNKQAFVTAFVSRPRFASALPTTLTPAQFVDALYANAGVTPTAAERTAAINEFGSAATTTDLSARASVLRRVVENPRLAQQEFNRAFVLMQYFGYLRRNPDEAPDLNFDGFNFWLNKLNQFNGNFVQAEMVKAFINSVEFRRRFGP